MQYYYLLVFLFMSLVCGLETNNIGYLRPVKHANHLRMLINHLTTPSLPTINNLNDDKPEKNILNLTVNVGDTVKFKCSISSNNENNAGVMWIRGKLADVLTLNNNRITEDLRYDIIHNVDNDHVESFDLVLKNLQFSDENEYSCESSSFVNNNEITITHTFVYLHVTKSPSFVEENTSLNTITVNENSNLVISCFALGRPNPTIKWYRLNQDGKNAEDLNIESNLLEIKNVTHNNNSIYECVATNGIQPSISKKFTITILYSPIVKAIKQQVHFSSGHTASVGCVVNSNPPSTILWYKNENLIIPSQQDTKYEIIMFHQINQTVTYLKVNNLKNTDFDVYKCEAFNTIGKQSQTIQVIETILAYPKNYYHHHHNHQKTESTKSNSYHLNSDHSYSSDENNNDDDRPNRTSILEYRIKTNHIKTNEHYMRGISSKLSSGLLINLFNLLCFLIVN